MDSAVAHLAGALGVPVWMFSWEPGDSQWLVDREDTVWYPTMRLFRQALPFEWGPVIERAREELAKMGGSAPSRLHLLNHAGDGITELLQHVSGVHK